MLVKWVSSKRGRGVYGAVTAAARKQFTAAIRPFGLCECAMPAAMSSSERFSLLSVESDSEFI